MTEELEVKIPYSDLTRISFVCSCGTEITVDMESSKNREHAWEEKTIKCPTCFGTFNDELKYALDRFDKWLGRIKKANLPVFFRVRKTSVTPQ